MTIERTETKDQRRQHWETGRARAAGEGFLEEGCHPEEGCA